MRQWSNSSSSVELAQLFMRVADRQSSMVAGVFLTSMVA